MPTCELFDVSTLEIGDIFHFKSKFSDDMRLIITNIAHVEGIGGYTLSQKNGPSLIYTDMDLRSGIESNTYTVRKPFAGLELI